MGRKCTICEHRRRKKIDDLLKNNVTPLRWIARIFGVSHTALFRHKLNHLTGGDDVRGQQETVQVPKQKIQIFPTVHLKNEGVYWDTLSVHFQGEELATCYIKKAQNLIFDSKGLGKLFSLMEDLDNER